MKPIKTSRLILRPFRRRDAAAVSYNSTRPVVARFMPDMVLKTPRDARRWIRWANRQRRDMNATSRVILAVVRKSDNLCIGTIGIGPKRELGGEIEIGYFIADEHQNQGYITEAGRAMADWAFAHMPLPYLVAIVKPDNPASSRVIEKLGFTPAGERKVDCDTLRYYRLKRPGDTCPEPITERTRDLVTAFIAKEWHGTGMLIRGEVIDMTQVDGFVWLEPDGVAIRGLVTYIVCDGVCEITSLNSQRENRGVGTALVELVKAKAREQGCTRLQLITTNDNINAIRLYQKRGFDLVGVNHGAIDRARAQKPEIPLIGQNGIEIHHEIEFAMEL